MGIGIYKNDFSGLGKSFVIHCDEDSDDLTSNQIIEGITLGLGDIIHNEDGKIANMAAHNKNCTALASDNLIMAGYHHSEDTIVFMVAPRDDPASVNSSGLTILDLISNISQEDAYYSQHDVMTDFGMLEGELLKVTRQLVTDISDYILLQLLIENVPCSERRDAWTCRPIMAIDDKPIPSTKAELSALQEKIGLRIKENQAIVNRTRFEKISALSANGRDFIIHEIDNCYDESPFGITTAVAIIGEEQDGKIPLQIVNAVNNKKLIAHEIPVTIMDKMHTSFGMLHGKQVETLSFTIPAKHLGLGEADSINYTDPDVLQAIAQLYDVYSGNRDLFFRDLFFTDMEELERAGVDYVSQPQSPTPTH